jgi:hypothetical protein
LTQANNHCSSLRKNFANNDRRESRRTKLLQLPPHKYQFFESNRNESTACRWMRAQFEAALAIARLSRRQHEQRDSYVVVRNANISYYSIRFVAPTQSRFVCIHSGATGVLLPTQPSSVSSPSSSVLSSSTSNASSTTSGGGANASANANATATTTTTSSSSSASSASAAATVSTNESSESYRSLLRPKSRCVRHCLNSQFVRT